MQKFSFKLATVARFRETQVELEKAKLEQLIAQLRSTEEHQKHLSRELALADRDVKSGPAPRPSELQALDRYVRRTGRLELQLEGHKQELQRRINEQRGRVQEAERNANLLDKLREREAARWKIAFDKEQEELASEAFLAKWTQNP